MLWRDNMNVVLISDLHANAFALEALRGVLDQADVVMCLGDLVGYYCQVNEVIDAVRERGAVCVLGNHDHFLLHGCPSGVPEHVRWGIAHAGRVISDVNRAYLASLPLVWSGEVDGRRFLLSHGSPWRPLEDYLYQDQCDLHALREFDVDVLAFGQTHRPWQDDRARPVIVNTGSVGQSRHARGRACAVVVATESLSIEAIEEPYDVATTIKLARKHGAGEWITKHLA